MAGLVLLAVATVTYRRLNFVITKVTACPEGDFVCPTTAVRLRISFPELRKNCAILQSAAIHPNSDAWEPEWRAPSSYLFGSYYDSYAESTAKIIPGTSRS